MLRAGSILLTSLLLAPFLPAQQKSQYRFSAHSWLVVEAVTVTNRQGEAIPGLTAKGFVVTEDGVRQSIAFCEFQKLDGHATPARPAEPAPQSAATALDIAPRQYPGRRLVALYFDMTAMPLSDQLRALGAARNFIARDLEPADQVAILEYDGTGVQVKLDFTANHAALQRALGQITLGALGYTELSDDADAADHGSAFGQDSAAFNIFNTNRQLAALQTAVDMLAPIEQKKSLVIFAGGLNLQGADNEAQLEATTNAALRANVSLFPVDARGLVASAPLGDATQGSTGSGAMYTGSAAAAFGLRLQSSQDTLYALASDTGGKALLDSNDLARGIITARNAISSYYLIGYYTSNPTRDGRYRRVRVSLTPARSARLSYRRGYYAQKVFAKFTVADKERQLEDALLLGNPITQLHLALAINYFQLDSADYFVPIAVTIPGRELRLAKKRDAQVAVLDFIGEVKDAYGMTITNLRDQVRLKLHGRAARQLENSPLEYTAGFTLLPGQYSIKLLARDDATGRIGTYLTHFTVPNLMHPTPALPISSVVLSAQRQPVSAAAFNANKSLAGLADDPLVTGGSELLPSTTHVFSHADPLYIYLQAYARKPMPAAPIAAYVSFYRGGKLVYESPLAAFAPAPLSHDGAIPIHITVPAGALAPGSYLCQLSVLDAAARRAAFWRAPIAVR
ncbi:MAG: VWA domain-containing protein [Terriglobales bacterium]